jgi:putative membrane protein
MLAPHCGAFVVRVGGERLVAGSIMAEPTSEHFAWLRTRMAAERTFMAWLRTAASMIGFGFTIVQFFANLDQLEGARPHAPRMLGLMLVGAGVVGLGFALQQFRAVLRHLDGPEYAGIKSGHPPASPAVIVAIVVLVIGVFAFAAIVLRAS